MRSVVASSDAFTSHSTWLKPLALVFHGHPIHGHAQRSLSVSLHRSLLLALPLLPPFPDDRRWLRDNQHPVQLRERDLRHPGRLPLHHISWMLARLLWKREFEVVPLTVALTMYRPANCAGAISASSKSMKTNSTMSVSVTSCMRRMADTQGALPVRSILLWCERFLTR